MDNNKMIIAILSGDDSADTISELNKNGFYVTVLSTSGGFLKRKSVTLLIGTEEENVDKVTEYSRARPDAARSRCTTTPPAFPSMTPVTW